MGKAPKVSVVTVTYNHEQFIGQTLEGILAQKTDFSFEVIVSDDCSTDSTPEIIRQYAKKYPDIIKPVLRKKNIGVVANNLESLRAASGQYIALCEGDDYWTDANKLQRQADFLDGHKSYALCFHPVVVRFEDDETKNFIAPDPDAGTDYTVDELLRRNFIQTNSVMYRRQDYRGMPENVMPLDWYLHLYHASFGKIGFINHVMSVYRIHKGGVWHQSYDDMDVIWRKYGRNWLALYEAMLKLYGGNKGRRELIDGFIVSHLNILHRVDVQYGEHQMRQATAEYPEAAELYINDLVKRSEKLDEHSREQAKIIDHFINLNKQLESEKQSINADLDRLKARYLVRLGDAARRLKRGKL